MNVKVWLLWTRTFAFFHRFLRWLSGPLQQLYFPWLCAENQPHTTMFPLPDSTVGAWWAVWSRLQTRWTIQPRVTDPPRSSLALSEENVLFLALCEATLHSSDSSVRRVVSKVQSGEVVKVLGDFFAFTCATNWWWKRFIGHQSGLSQLISVWGPAYFLITGFSCFLASCLFAVPFDFITQR